MLSAKRMDKEPFEKYKARLKKEAAQLKLYLKGRLVWCSCIITERKDKEGKPTGQLVKVKAQGTYRKETK